MPELECRTRRAPRCRSSFASRSSPWPRLVLLRCALAYATIARGSVAEAADIGVLGLSTALCDMGEQPPVALGDPIRLCLFLSSSPVQRMIFQIKVEQYAQLSLKGSQAKALKALDHVGGLVHTWAAVSSTSAAKPLDCTSRNDIDSRGHHVSCPQVYASTKHAAQVVNLVINLQEGKVSSFAWDNGCAGCASSQCMRSHKHLQENTTVDEADVQEFEQGTCGADFKGCVASGMACDLKVYVTWAGTDKHGQNALSAGMRLSKFTGATLKSLYASLDEKYKELTAKAR